MSEAALSAGILLYRRRAAEGPGPGERAGAAAGTSVGVEVEPALEVLLVHPGGPFWAKKDAHAWSIPKGLIEDGETPLEAAVRELGEETGATLESVAKDAAKAVAITLPPIRVSSGKVLHTFAVEGDFEVEALRCGQFELEWPPRSGRLQSFPEVDRAAWFSLGAARTRLHKGQVGLIDHLAEVL